MSAIFYRVVENEERAIKRADLSDGARASYVRRMENPKESKMSLEGSGTLFPSSRHAAHLREIARSQRKYEGYYVFMPATIIFLAFENINIIKISITRVEKLHACNVHVKI